MPASSLRLTVDQTLPPVPGGLPACYIAATLLDLRSFPGTYFQITQGNLTIVYPRGPTLSAASFPGPPSPYSPRVHATGELQVVKRADIAICNAFREV